MRRRWQGAGFIGKHPTVSPARAQVRSGWFRGITREAPAGLFIAPMECQSLDRLPEGEEWQYEPKLDGYRVIVARKGKETFLFSRRGLVFNERYPKLLQALKELPGKSFALDGEIVAFDAEGRPDFELVQEPDEEKAPMHLFVFDLLANKGKQYLTEPLARRRDRLEDELQDLPPRVRLCPVLSGALPVLLKKVEEFKLEGLVAKRRDSFYYPGERPGVWLKQKIQPTDEFVVGGYIAGAQGFDELLVGIWRGKDFDFVESVKNGFVPRTKELVLSHIKKLRRARCPFVNLPETGAGRMTAEKMMRVRWVRPRVVVEVAFNQWTSGGHLRHAKFLRLRADKMR